MRIGTEHSSSAIATLLATPSNNDQIRKQKAHALTTLLNAWLQMGRDETTALYSDISNILEAVAVSNSLKDLVKDQALPAEVRKLGWMALSEVASAVADAQLDNERLFDKDFAATALGVALNGNEPDVRAAALDCVTSFSRLNMGFWADALVRTSNLVATIVSAPIEKVRGSKANQDASADKVAQDFALAGVKAIGTMLFLYKTEQGSPVSKDLEKVYGNLRQIARENRGAFAVHRKEALQATLSLAKHHTDYRTPQTIASIVADCETKGNDSPNMDLRRTMWGVVHELLKVLSAQEKERELPQLKKGKQQPAVGNTASPEWTRCLSLLSITAKIEPTEMRETALDALCAATKMRPENAQKVFDQHLGARIAQANSFSPDKTDALVLNAMLRGHGDLITDDGIVKLVATALSTPDSNGIYSSIVDSIGSATANSGQMAELVIDALKRKTPAILQLADDNVAGVAELGIRITDIYASVAKANNGAANVVNKLFDKNAVGFIVKCASWGAEGIHASLNALQELARAGSTRLGDFAGDILAVATPDKTPEVNNQVFNIIESIDRIALVGTKVVTAAQVVASEFAAYAKDLTAVMPKTDQRPRESVIRTVVGALEMAERFVIDRGCPVSVDVWGRLADAIVAPTLPRDVWVAAMALDKSMVRITPSAKCLTRPDLDVHRQAYGFMPK